MSTTELTKDHVGTPIVSTQLPSLDQLVKVSGADTVASFLADKLAAGAGITLTILNPGADEDLEIAATAAAPTRELFWAATDYNANADGLDFRARNVAGTGSHRFTFFVPFDAVTIIDVALIAISGLVVAAPAADIDLFSDYGTDGEQADNHSESDTTSTYVIPIQSELFEIDISGVFSALAANDRCGIFVDHNSIGGDIDYIGLRLRYSTV